MVVAVGAGAGAEKAPELRVPRFRDVAAAAGVSFHHLRGSVTKEYIVETKGGGCAVFDFNGDGREDLYFINGSTFELLASGKGPGNKLYRNEGGWRFTEVGEAAGVADRGWGIAAAAADYDGDGRIDLFITNWGPNKLFRNRGDGTFEDVTDRAGVGHAGFGAGAVWVDMDRDGHLDLYVANYLKFDPATAPRRGDSRSCHLHGIPILVGPVGLPKEHDIFYHNNGDGTFSDWSETAGFRAVKPGYGLGAIAGDVNQDGWPDIYVANDSTANFLFLNRGDGTVRDAAFESGVAFNEAGMAQAGMGTEMADFRGAGREDIFVCNYENDTNTFYANEGGELCTDETARRGLASPSYQYVGWAVLAADFNHDRAVDLIIGNGHVVPQADQVRGNPGYRQPNQLYLNDGTGGFLDVTARTGPGLAVRGATRGSAAADLDGDGDLDVIFNNIDGPPTVLECEGAPLHPWLGVRLQGRGKNRFGLGAWVGIEDDKGRQIRYMRVQRSWGSTSEPVVRFGLGAAAAVRRLVVLWPAGNAESFPPGAVNRVATCVEGQGAATAWPFFTIAPPRAR